MRCIKLICFLLLALPIAAQTYDQYGGLVGFACPANTSVITPDVTYTITNVQRSGTTVTLTLSAAPSKLYINAGITVSGTAQDGGSFNTPTPTTSSTQPFYITNIAGSTVQFTQSGNTINHADGGTVRLARFWVAQIGTEWYMCTPLGLRFKSQGIFDIDELDNTVDFQGNNSLSALQTKYATGTTPFTNFYQLNWALSVVKSMQKWNFNSISVQGTQELVKPMVVPGGQSWGTADGTIPTKIQTQGWSWPSHYSQANAPSGSMTQNAKGYANSVKESVGVQKISISPGLRGQIDPFDPNFANYLHTLETDTVFTLTWVNGPHSDFFSYWLPDDTDGIMFSKAGVDFQTIRDGGTEPYPGSASPHVGWMTLLASPFKTADTANLNADINSGANVYSANGTFYAKQEFANWLQGTTDQTTGVPASRSGTTVTLTFNNQNANGVYSYVPIELISVSGCSDSTFNTTAGAGITINSSGFSSGQIQYTLAGAGSSATGCQISSGPRYASIAALNTAWGTGAGGYDTFGTDATNRNDTICASSCTATTYSFTLTTHPLSPETLFVTVGGTIVAGSDGAGAVDASPSAVDNVVGATISSGTINTSTGALSITFTAAPNAAVAVTYKSGGWGSGQGLLDEDGTCPSKGAANCWVPNDAFSICRTDYATNWAGTCSGDNSTAALRNDLDNFLFHLCKVYFKTVKNEMAIVSPGAPYGSTTNMGNWQSPVRRQVLQASQYYTDFITVQPYGNGNAVDQPIANFLGQFGGNKGWVAWFGGLANSSSYFQFQCPVHSGSLDCTNQPATQAARGAAYLANVQTMYSMTDSTYNVVHGLGFNYWRYIDQRGEGNWGLRDPIDNAYDGVETATGTVTCSTPISTYNCGGENAAFGAPYTANGNFVTPVTNANFLWVDKLINAPKRTTGHSLGGGRTVN